MTAEIILHIGQHKTGSTSIQKTLEAARDWLRSQGVLYPFSDVISHNHRSLAPAVFDFDQSGLKYRMGTNEAEALSLSDKEWEKVRVQFHPDIFHKVILSAEDFFEPIDLIRSERFRKKLCFDTSVTFRILAYIRSPATFFMSRLQQNLRSGIPLPKPGIFDPLIKTLESYKRCFGQTPDVRPFEKGQLVSGDVVADFSSWIGYPSIAKDFRVNDANSSISSEAMSVLFSMRAGSSVKNYDAVKRQRALVKVLRKLDAKLTDPTKPKLNNDFASAINSANYDLIVLRDRYNVEFEDVDYMNVGKKSFKSDQKIARIEDLCKVNADRRDMLAARVKEVLYKTV